MFDKLKEAFRGLAEKQHADLASLVDQAATDKLNLSPEALAKKLFDLDCDPDRFEKLVTRKRDRLGWAVIVGEKEKRREAAKKANTVVTVEENRFAKAVEKLKAEHFAKMATLQTTQRTAARQLQEVNDAEKQLRETADPQLEKSFRDMIGPEGSLSVFRQEHMKLQEAIEQTTREVARLRRDCEKIRDRLPYNKQENQKKLDQKERDLESTEKQLRSLNRKLNECKARLAGEEEERARRRAKLFEP